MKQEQSIRQLVARLLYLCLALLLVAAVAWKFCAVWQADTPKELREATLVYFARAFSRGENPYALSTLSWEDLPSPTNLYGFLAPLLLAPFLKIFSGFSAMQVCETVLLVVELTGLAAFYAAVHTQTGSHLSALLGTLLVYGCYYRFTPAGGAFPDSLGLALTLVLLWLVQRDETRGRYHPVVYAVLVVLLFYTKQYFVFCLPGLMVYLFLHSRRDLIFLIVSGGVMGLISLPIVNAALPLYFPCSLAVAQSSTATGSWRYSLSQIFRLGMKWYLAVSLLLAAAAIFLLLRCLCHQPARIPGLCDGISLSYPLCEAIFTFPLVAVIGQNQGTEYTYYLQLWWPYLIACAMTVLVWLVSLPRLHRWSPVLMAGICLVGVVQIFPAVWSLLLSPAQLQEWADSLAIVDSRAEQGEVLLAAEFSNHCLEQGIPTGEYGQAEYNEEINYEKYLASPIWPKLFPQAERIFRNNHDYYTLIRQKLEQQDYALVAINSNGLASYLLTPEELESFGYTLTEEHTLITGGWTWDVLFYVPDLIA